MSITVGTIRTYLQDKLGQGRQTVDERAINRAIVAGLTMLSTERYWSFHRREKMMVTTQPYDTGTVTMTNGSTTVEGAGVTWAAGVAGATLLVDGVPYLIASRTDSNTLEIDVVFEGTTAALKSYSIVYPDVTLPTTSGAVPRMVDAVHIRGDGSWASLIATTIEKIGMDSAEYPFEGRPRLWATPASSAGVLELRLYPAPDDEYPLNVVYFATPATPNTASDAATIDWPDHLLQLLKAACFLSAAEDAYPALLGPAQSQYDKWFTKAIIADRNTRGRAVIGGQTPDHIASRRVLYVGG